MKDLINCIITKNVSLTAQREKSINFSKDFEGKRMLNTQINFLYDRERSLTIAMLTDIIVTCHVVIAKMEQLTICDWTIKELKLQLVDGLINYEKRNKIKLDCDPGSRVMDIANEKINKIQFKPITRSDTEFLNEDFRDKFPATLRTNDGHLVRSRGELIIDNALYQYKIAHAYERKVPIKECLYSDFFIPTGEVFIEFWGLEGDAKYEERKKTKIGLYSKYHFNLIQLTNKELSNLDDYLPKRLLDFNIKIINA